ncbi:Fe-S cluster assembly ATPase SufC [Candidatus Woesearchaeota archaeon]|nr:Fe-S cluster assembly ATPase SufC [Candidatus Woesearchaeota archaeon]
MALEVNNLKVEVDGNIVVKGVSFVIGDKDVVALMGPNGSGKSSLALALMGHPRYKIKSGSAVLDGVDITGISPEQRAKLGLFLSFQNPVDVPGLGVETFLRQAYNSVRGRMGVMDFHLLLKDRMSSIGVPGQFSSRDLRGFSGGERKRMELLQMSLLNPKIAILDEIDSGLDSGALKDVASELKKLSAGLLLITHYIRMLEFLRPDVVHVMKAGQIMRSGDFRLALRMDREGFG